jgi:glycine/D-amino acid oxidase-like deaminating enzyme
VNARREYDVSVIGLGGLGSGAAYGLARRFGDRVIGLEQFALGHHNGASQDHSRIIRLSYHRPDYVRLARRAYTTYGEPGPKAAQDVGGREVTPATRTFEPDEAAHRRLNAFLARHLPGMVAPPIRTQTCLYTLTPDRDFVVDRVPGHPNVVVLLGAAHGFKYASVLGRIAAELVADGVTPSAPELEGFRIGRDRLRASDPSSRS